MAIHIHNLFKIVHENRNTCAPFTFAQIYFTLQISSHIFKYGTTEKKNSSLPQGAPAPAPADSSDGPDDERATVGRRLDLAQTGAEITPTGGVGGKRGYPPQLTRRALRATASSLHVGHRWGDA